MDKPRANIDSQNSPRPKLGGNHHLPPYSIHCAWPWDQYVNVILSQDSQVKVPKFPQLGFPQLWGPITSCANLQLRWGLKKSYSPSQGISNSMLHTTCTQGNRSDSWLLMVESQIGNLTPGSSFGYNLCLKCPNGSCEPFRHLHSKRFPMI
jgi:hypothetical protein